MTRRFRQVRPFRKGYSRKQVDSFISAVEASLSGMLPPISATEVRRAGFELVHGGYRTDEVDRALDALEERVLARPHGGGRRGRLDPAAEIDYLKSELAKPYLNRFPRARALGRGYDIDDVDEFVDQLVKAFDTGRPVPPAAVRAARFRPRRGGYDEHAVDDTLDRVIELLLLLSGAPAAPDR